MNAAPVRDSAAEYELSRAALRALLPRLANLLPPSADRDAPSRLPGWSVADVGAHLSTVYLAFAATASQRTDMLAGLLPADDGPLVSRLTEVNERAVASVGADERARLGELLVERGGAFLDSTAGMPPETVLPTPWYGQRVALTVGAATGLVLSETLVHGRDIALGRRQPWTIEQDAARLALVQFLPPMMPLTLDQTKARGQRLTAELVLRGGGSLSVVVENGAATVSSEPAPRYDCRVVASPAAFLLLTFRRMPLWRAIAGGHLRSGGRRPWLGPKLYGMFRSP
jgi:uncharacterized protein (TIGR03083 family)